MKILFVIGTIHWFGIFLVHPILVDIDLVLGRHSPIGPEVRPDGDAVRSMLIANTWEFGLLGRTTAHRALSGFSLWVPMSAFFIGLINLVIGLSPKLPQALFSRLTVLNLVAYAVFTVFAFTFFVRLPQLNGVTGTVLFGLATYGMARAKPAGT